MSVRRARHAATRPGGEAGPGTPSRPQALAARRPPRRPDSPGGDSYFLLCNAEEESVKIDNIWSAWPGLAFPHPPLSCTYTRPPVRHPRRDGRRRPRTEGSRLPRLGCPPGSPPRTAQCTLGRVQRPQLVNSRDCRLCSCGRASSTQYAHRGPLYLEGSSPWARDQVGRRRRRLAVAAASPLQCFAIMARAFFASVSSHVRLFDAVSRACS